MPTIETADGTNLYYEEAGTGTAVVFVHEFAGDYRTWEPQMRYFSRLHRCVTYSQRGIDHGRLLAGDGVARARTDQQRRRRRGAREISSASMIAITSPRAMSWP